MKLWSSKSGAAGGRKSGVDHTDDSLIDLVLLISSGVLVACCWYGGVDSRASVQYRAGFMTECEKHDILGRPSEITIFKALRMS